MSVVQLAVLDTGSNRTLAERLIDQLAVQKVMAHEMQAQMTSYRELIGTALPK